MTVNEETALLPVAELARLIQRGELSPVDLVDSYLRRIERFDGILHTYITVCREAALSCARDCLQESRQGVSRGPLHGIPVALKDNICTEGVETTGGSRAFLDFDRGSDATVVAKLKQAGAIILGKLSLAEFALGGTRVYVRGKTVNPWNPKHSPGESSSGAGAAVASGLCAAALGSDTGGSIRNPASSCGIVGLRPTTGLVSRHGLLPLSWSMDTIGPMTRTVEDCALLLSVIAGPDRPDEACANPQTLDYSALLGRDIAGVRLGIVRELTAADRVAGAIGRAFDEAIDVYRGLGASVTVVSIPLLGVVSAVYDCICNADGASAWEEVLRTRASELDSNTRTRLLAALFTPSYVYHRAQQVRALLARQFEDVLSNVDVLVSPTLPAPPVTLESFAPRYASEKDLAARAQVLPAFMAGYALAGLPAISLPCGFSPGGLPIGFQIGGRPLEEATVLRVAQAFESATDFHTMHPPMPPA